MTTNKPRGGRGIKAPYETTHLRIPLPIKADIEKLIDNYRASVLDGIEPENNDLISLQDAIALYKKLTRSKVIRIDTVAKLLTAIYKTDVSPDDLRL
jgi:hypothetical protein